MIHFPKPKTSLLNQQGIAHLILPGLVMLAVAGIGTYLLVSGHAQTLPNNPYSCPSEPQIGVGNAGTCVKTVQWYLNNFRRTTYNEAPITVDGDFGPNTKSAVEQFQKWQNISVDGIVGPQTWREFNSCATSGICK